MGRTLATERWWLGSFYLHGDGSRPGYRKLPAFLWAATNCFGGKGTNFIVSDGFTPSEAFTSEESWEEVPFRNVLLYRLFKYFIP